MAYHGYSIVGKKFGPHEGAREKGKERETDRDEAQVRQDKREGRRKGENVNFYENMIHHSEGGMIAPGECPLTVGGSKGRPGRAIAPERLRGAGE